MPITVHNSLFLLFSDPFTMLTPSQYSTSGLTDNITNLTTDAASDDEAWRFDDDIQRRLVGTGLLIVCITGIIGNSLVIAAVSLTLKLQNVTNVFVCNLAVGDLLHCIILPFMVHDLYQPLDLVNPNPLVCAVNGILTVLFLSVSVFSHALIAVTRYMMITRPRRACQVLFTPCRIFTLLLLIWTVSSIDPIVSLSSSSSLGYNPKYGICSRDIRNKSSVILSSVRSIYTNLFSVVVVLFCYAKVFFFVKRHNNSTLRRILTSSSGGGSIVSRKTLEETMVFEDVNTSAIRETKIDNGEEGQNGYVISMAEADHHADSKIDPDAGESVHNGKLKTISHMNADLTHDNDKMHATVNRDRFVNDLSFAAIAPVESQEIHSVHQPDIVNDSLLSAKVLSHSKQSTDNCFVKPTDGTKNDVSNQYINNVFTEHDDVCPPSCSCNDGLSVTYSTCHAPHCSIIVGSQFNYFNGNDREKAKGKSRKDSRKFSWRWRSRKSQDGPSDNRKEIDITMKLFIVVCVFFACISPYIFFVSLKSLERLLPYAALLLASSSCFNPIIYGLAHPQFQSVFYLLVSCQISKIKKPSRLLKWLTKYKIVPGRPTSA